MTFSLASGEGDTDNALFAINQKTLSTAKALNYENKAVYSIRIQADDGTNGKFSKIFKIYCNNLNDGMTDILISTPNTKENQPAGTTIGEFTTIDEDSKDIPIYSLVDNGSTDYLSFYLEGSQLKNNAYLNFELKKTYQIRIKTDDQHGATFEKDFTIQLVDANDKPTNILLSNSKVEENLPNLTLIGTLSVVDEDVVDNASILSYTFFNNQTTNWRRY